MKSEVSSGLTSAEAHRRLAVYGFNDPVPLRRAVPILQFLRLFANPLVIILLIASVVSVITGDVVNAVIIIVMVLMGVTLNFIQTARSERAAEALRKEVAPVATALRDGEWREIPRREIVPGDLIRLSAGDMIPADARLVESRDLHAQQATLTGESLPVEKEAAPASQTVSDQNEGRNMVFLGTSVVSGLATARVVATGRLIRSVFCLSSFRYR